MTNYGALFLGPETNVLLRRQGDRPPTTRCLPAAPRATRAACGWGSSSRPAPTSASRRRRRSRSGSTAHGFCALEHFAGHKEQADIRLRRYGGQKRARPRRLAGRRLRGGGPLLRARHGSGDGAVIVVFGGPRYDRAVRVDIPRNMCDGGTGFRDRRRSTDENESYALCPSLDQIPAFVPVATPRYSPLNTDRPAISQYVEPENRRKFARVEATACEIL